MVKLLRKQDPKHWKSQESQVKGIVMDKKRKVEQKAMENVMNNLYKI